MILHEKTTPETKKSDRSRSFRCLICVYAELRESLDHPLQVQLHEPLLRMLGDQKSTPERLALWKARASVLITVLML